MTGIVLTVPEFTAAWGAKLQDAADSYPTIPFDGRTSLAAWLAESAREQAERVFLALDGTPVERRDLGEAEAFIQRSGFAFLSAWAQTMAAFHTDGEPWAKAAASAAVRVYHDRLDELAPGLHAGGRS